MKPVKEEENNNANNDLIVLKQILTFTKWCESFNTLDNLGGEK